MTGPTTIHFLWTRIARLFALFAQHDLLLTRTCAVESPQQSRSTSSDRSPQRREMRPGLENRAVRS